MTAQSPVQAADNLRVWDAVSKTDPRHTKHVNQRGGFTAISAHYQVMSATAQFGPVGEGWGYYNGEPIFNDTLVFVPVTLWHGDRGNTFGPLYGGAEWKSAKGHLDSDALKKASTDGLTKALSQLGFNADVFLGRFDDNKYVAEVAAEFVAADTPREKVPGIHKIKERLRTFQTAGNAATVLENFKALVKANRDDIKAIRDANHSWWTGDGEDFEGYRDWMDRRYAELAPAPERSLGFQMLASALAECARRDDLTSLVDQHNAVIEELDGEESRLFEGLFAEREAAVIALSNVSAG